MWFNLRNEGSELFQHVAEIDLTHHPELRPSSPDLQPIVTDTNGQRVPAQYLSADSTLLVLVEGLWGLGEERRLAVRWTDQEENQPPTDLTVRANGGISIDNVYFGISHPPKGGGGFPTEIRFNISGNVDQGFTFEDRLFDKQRGWFAPKLDSASTAKLVVEGPLRAIVECRFRYVNRDGTPAPGNAQARYRWTYTAHSPVARIEAVVERDGDLDFTWPELHFLQISRDDAQFNAWAGGDPLVSGTLGPQSHSEPFGRWGVLHKALDAVALAIEGGLTFWDGTTEYVTYLQRCESWDSARREYHADLYMGPARTPERIRHALLARPDISVSSITPTTRPLEAQVAGILSSRHLKLTFSRGQKGSLGLAGLERIASGHNFVTGMPSEGFPVWRLRLRGPQIEELILDSREAGECSLAMEDERATLSWKGIDLADEADILDVTVTVALPKESNLSFWRLQVENHSQRYGIWQTEFPVIGDVAESGHCDVAVPRSNWGLLYQNLAQTQTGSYPSANWPVQMLTLNEDTEGLYLACHDPEAWPKQFSLTPGGEFRFSVMAENAGVPGSDFTTPGAVAIGVYEGNWWNGCKLYRAWALANAPWTQKGRLSTRADMPDSIKNLALWFLGSGTRDEIVPAMLQAHEFFGLPLGLHWYNWHQIPFDTHYPEYFPTKPGFAEGVQELTSHGMLAMPYINGRLHDMDIPSFAEAEPWCTKKENGENYLEIYPSQARQAVMCPYTNYWQKRISRVVERLVEECGVNAVYLDQIAAAAPAPCFDPDHGHPLGGGSHWVAGYRELLKLTKAIGHRDGRAVAFTTENNAEPYMDGVDAFLIWNPRHPQEIPMMTAIYSGYTLYFTSPRMQNTPESFWMGQVRDCIWGCQLGWMDPTFFTSPSHAIEAADLKRLGEYRVACRKFLTYGELLGELEVRGSLPDVHGTWDNWSGPPQQVILPAVKTAVWRAEDDSLGLFLANLANRSMTFRYHLDLEHFGAFKRKGQWLAMTRLAPEATELAGFMPPQGGERVEFLAPKELLVYEVKPVEKLSLAKMERATRYRERAEMDAWCLSRNLTWDIVLPTHVARGEPLRVDVLLTNGGARNVVAEARLQANGAPVYETRALIEAGKTVRLALSGGPVVGEEATSSLTLELTDERSGTRLALPVVLQVVEPVSLTMELPPGIRAGESATSIIHVTNNRLEDADVLLGLRGPSGWEFEPGATIRVPNIAAGETRKIWVRIAVPDSAERSPAAVQAFVIEGRASGTIEMLPLPLRAKAVRLPTALSIDGELGEWRNVPGLTLGPETAANLKDYGGADDLSGIVRFAWDEEHLYIAAEVTDQVHSQPYTGQPLWQGDCLQLALRPGRPPSAFSYANVRELGLALTAEGPLLWEWMPQERVLEQGKIAAIREGTQTRYEAAIPWKQLHMRPNSPIAAGITLNDDDGQGFRGWLEWAAGVCGTKDASKFGVLELQ
ncbi:MAG: DUF6259 domain-containing protein [Candidatus Zipacnadales bacterium]